MQRKNYILKNRIYKMRSAIAMIMALIVLVVISTLMALSLSMTTETSKRTTDLYLHEQVVLYSKSAAELALLNIATGGPCTTIAPYTLGGIYDINVTLKYIYNDTSICAVANRYFDVSTEEQNGSVLMDITVTTNAGIEPIRYFRRSIQKL